MNNLIIAGVNKAATSSLYTYLSYHHQILKSNVKETEFFLPIRYGKKINSFTNYLNFFEKKKINTQKKYLLESTPGYFYGGKNLAKSIKKYNSKCKIIIILRNPVRRTESFINHCISKTWLDKNVDFNLELSNVLREVDLNNLTYKNENQYYIRSITESFYANLIKEWKIIFNSNLKIIYFENLIKNPELVLISLCDWLAIDSIKKNQFKYSIENKSIKPNNIFIHQKILKIYSKFEPFFRKNLKLKNYIRDFYYDLNSKGKSSLNSKIETRLNEIFQQKNDIEIVRKYLEPNEVLGWEKFIK